MDCACDVYNKMDGGITQNLKDEPMKIFRQFIFLLPFAVLLTGNSALAQEVFPPDNLSLEEIRQSIPNISTDELKREIEQNPDTYLIDVRTVREAILTGGIIRAKRSMTIPRGWLEYRISEVVPDKDAPIIVYCGTNRRSPVALLTLQQLGYTNVKNYSGGFNEWKKAGYGIESPDEAPDSFLYSLPQKVAQGVWSAIGQTAPSTYENAGHNNNLSFIITDDGVVVFNGGGSWLLAQTLHDEIRKITDQPVKLLVLENGQGHAALGASYWHEQGVRIIAHEDAKREFEERGERILASAKRRLKDKLYKTRLVEIDEVFSGRKDISMGGVKMELLDLGPAHSPGDIMLWLPEKKLVISGDMAFHQRLLPVFEDTDTAGWIETWDKFEGLGAELIIPGHGTPTQIEEVTKYTKDYLVYMRAEIQKILDADGGLGDAYKIDQSAYEHLDTFEFLALRNAARIFQSMEFE